MELCILSLPQFFEGEAEVLKRLLEWGDFRLHLRKPLASSSALALLLNQIGASYWSRIVLHDAFELAQDYPLGGLHLNRRNPQAPHFFTGRISCSCHSWEDLLTYKPSCSYLFLSPLFDSISKANYKQAFSRDELEAAQQKGWIDQQVFGLGGVSAARIPLLKQLGFGGAAVLGALWGDYLSTFSHSDLLKRLDLIYKQINTKE